MEDQSDILAANERLTAEVGTLTAEVGTLTAEHDEALASVAVTIAKLDTEQASLAAVTAERDQARADLANVTADRDRLAAVDRNFSTRLAASLATHGIRNAGVAAPKTESVGLTLTELCMAARGAK